MYWTGWNSFEPPRWEVPAWQLQNIKGVDPFTFFRRGNGFWFIQILLASPARRAAKQAIRIRPRQKEKKIVGSIQTFHLAPAVFSNRYLQLLSDWGLILSLAQTLVRTSRSTSCLYFLVLSLNFYWSWEKKYVS